jgi:DNA processing protein
MDVDGRVEAWAFLQLVPGLSTDALVTLLKTFGGPVAVRDASRATLSRCVSGPIATSIRNGPEPGLLERTLAWLATAGHALVAWDDADYPAALLTVADPPPAFYYVGRRELLNRPALAVVGSRNATAEGIGNAEAFATALSLAGFTIVSGLSGGVDAAAHRGGLAAAGSSIAVVGTGLDRLYPPGNRALAERLAREGGVMSEFALGTAPLAANFPRRNRLISGLCRGVLVVEATLTSGALGTARLAAAQGREVFAIPGSIHSPFSKGSHRLIKEGAKLVETVDDVLDELRLRLPAAPVPSGTPAGTVEAGAVPSGPGRRRVR